MERIDEAQSRDQWRTVFCEYGNEHLFDPVSNFQVIKKDSVSWILFIYLPVYWFIDLFNDALSSSDIIQSNGRTIG
jgi:hypothetical protein